MTQFNHPVVTLVPRVRSGSLDLRTGYVPGFEPVAGKSLVYLGKTEGFPANLSFVKDDPYVRKAILRIYGRIPVELKGYSRSGATKTRIYEALAKYDVKRPKLPEDAAFGMAVQLAFEAFKLPTVLSPAPFRKVRLEMSASAGWTWLGYKKRQVYEAIVQESEKMQRLLSQGRLSKSNLPPCMAYKRTQLALLTKPKVRLVWGYPAEITLFEGRFAQPLIEAYSKRDCPMFFGRTLLKDLPMFMDNLFWYGKGVGLDFSSFDASASVGMIALAFKVLAQNFKFSTQQKREWDFIVDYFINTPLVLQDGHVFIKHGGVPSGSYFTQLVDSVINFIVITYLQLRSWGDVWTRIKTLGDDSVFSVPMSRDIDLDEWARIAHEVFRMRINIDKCTIATKPQDLEFLGHASKVGHVLRDDIKLHLLALYPEYQTDSPEIAVARVEGILVDSGFQSKAILALYLVMLELWGIGSPVRLSSGFRRHVVQREFPLRRMELYELQAVS